jgi:hypothetical protein
MAWGQGPNIGPDFTLVTLRRRVYSSYTWLLDHGIADTQGYAIFSHQQDLISI